MVAKWTKGLPDSEISPQALYERKDAIKRKVAAQLQRELFADTIREFPDLLEFRLTPVDGDERAIGISIRTTNEAALPKLERWADVNGHTLATLLDLLGAETGKRVAQARYRDVDVSVVGKVAGAAADYD